MPQTALTHAGVVVFRKTAAGPEVLVISPKSRSHEWVLPKGHIEPGEKAEDAARRELLEETGIDGEIVEPLGSERFRANGETVMVGFFLARYLSKRQPDEQRRSHWLPLDQAIECVSFAETRAVLDRARRALERHV